MSPSRQKSKDSRVFHVRMSSDEYYRLAQTAETLGITKSELARTLLSIPVDALEEGDGNASNRVLVCDVNTYMNINRQLRAGLSLYSQGISALNTVAAREDLPVTESLGLLKRGDRLLDEANDSINVLIDSISVLDLANTVIIR